MLRPALATLGIGVLRGVSGPLVRPGSRLGMARGRQAEGRGRGLGGLRW